MATSISIRDQLQEQLSSRDRHSASANRPIVAVDQDNLIVHRRGYRRLDIVAFCARARTEIGGDCLIRVFANGMSATDEADWVRNGAEVLRTRTNADPVILEWLYAMREARAVLLATGDKAFAAAANFHRKLRHRVVVWSCRAKAGTELLRAADRIEFCDELVVGKAGRPRRRHRPNTRLAGV